MRYPGRSVLWVSGRPSWSRGQLNCEFVFSSDDLSTAEGGADPHLGRRGCSRNSPQDRLTDIHYSQSGGGVVVVSDLGSEGMVTVDREERKGNGTPTPPCPWGPRVDAAATRYDERGTREEGQDSASPTSSAQRLLTFTGGGGHFLV